jgi:hypothetical protein
MPLLAIGAALHDTSNVSTATDAALRQESR